MNSSSNSSKLDSLINDARSSSDAGWGEDRGTRLLQSTLKERERRVVRSRVMRRSAILLSVAATVVIVFLRGMSAPVASATPSSSPSPMPTNEVIADLAGANGDGGYARD